MPNHTVEAIRDYPSYPFDVSVLTLLCVSRYIQPFGEKKSGYVSIYLNVRPEYMKLKVHTGLTLHG